MSCLLNGRPPDFEETRRWLADQSQVRRLKLLLMFTAVLEFGDLLTDCLWVNQLVTMYRCEQCVLCKPDLCNWDPLTLVRFATHIQAIGVR